MNTPASIPQTHRVVLSIASITLIFFGLYQARLFFIPIALSFFLAAVSFPITHWLREHGVPRFFSVLITVLVVFLFISGVLLVGFTLVNDLSQGERLQEYGKKLYNLSMDVGEQLETWHLEGAKKEIQKFLSAEKIGLFFKDNVTFMLSSILSTLKNSFIVIILLIFMLSEARVFARRFEAIVEAKGPNLQRMLSATHDIQKYLGIKTIISLATGLLAGVLCWALHIDFPLLWGILAFTLNYIPAIGSIIAGVPPVLLALLTLGLNHAIGAMIGYLIINGLLGNVIEPALLGRRFGLSTVVVFISVLFWGFLWGPVGMLLAVPLTMLLKVALDNSHDMRWLGVAISQGGKNEHIDQERLLIQSRLRRKIAPSPEDFSQSTLPKHLSGSTNPPLESIDTYSRESTEDATPFASI